ncbi:hypothetical protein KJ765_03610 [Candidatus Micrarchaeota archaeon]|nr:hypothetical protein [Candidatus Micrarchaeota archaeon]
MTAKEAYLEGRIIGLHNLINVLKESVDSDDKVEMTTIVKSMVNHIADEMDEIIKEMHNVHSEAGTEVPPMLQDVQKKAAVIRREAPEIEENPEEAPQQVKKHVNQSDDLMNSLMELRKKTAGRS